MNRAQASQAFAEWLGETHPQVYEAVFAQGVRRAFSGFGDDGDTSDFSDPQLQDITVDTDNLDYVVGTSESDAADALPLFDAPLGNAGTSTSPVSSAQGVVGSTQGVGNWLTSSSGLTAITNLGTAALNAVSTAQVAQVQMAVIQANAQRAAAAQAPIPISYITNAAGQTVPVYSTSAGSLLPTSLQQSIAAGTSTAVTLPNGTLGYTVPSTTLSSLLSGSNSLWLILGALALGLVMLEGSSV